MNRWTFTSPSAHPGISSPRVVAARSNSPAAPAPLPTQGPPSARAAAHTHVPDRSLPERNSNLPQGRLSAAFALPARIHYRQPADAALMHSRGMASAVRIIDHPRCPRNVTPQDEHMPAPNGDHSRCWRSPWELEPAGCQPKFPQRPTKDLHRCATSAKSAPRAASRMCDDSAR
jgi:hypothetical protein